MPSGVRTRRGVRVRKGAAAPTRNGGAGVRSASAAPLRVSRGCTAGKFCLTNALFARTILVGGDKMARRYARSYAKDRTERLEIRLSPMEKLELETEAKKRNMTLTGFLIGAALGTVAAVVDVMTEDERNAQAKK